MSGRPAERLRRISAQQARHQQTAHVGEVGRERVLERDQLPARVVVGEAVQVGQVAVDERQRVRLLDADAGERLLDPAPHGLRAASASRRRRCGRESSPAARRDRGCARPPRRGRSRASCPSGARSAPSRRRPADRSRARGSKPRRARMRSSSSSRSACRGPAPRSRCAARSARAAAAARPRPGRRAASGRRRARPAARPSRPRPAARGTGRRHGSSGSRRRCAVASAWQVRAMP